jgi:aryl-alcohol dehydrogenase-like predicted oxidoreductase
MDKRKIGSLDVSVIGLGCNNFGWRIDADKSTEVVNAALDEGINFFDTADMYGGGQSEEFLGRALGNRRGNALIATKFGMLPGGKPSGAKPEYVRQAAEASLRRLGTDYIDLYQIHVPDPNTPIEETLGALDELKRAGKVREIGCSNFSVEQLREAHRFVSVQNEYSLLHREPEKEVLPECERSGIAFLPYFPVASGLLTGKYRQGQAAPQGSRIQPGGYFDKIFTDDNLSKVESLIQFAASKNHTILEVAIAWLLTRPAIASVIAGATTPDQVRANAGAARWNPAATEFASI